MMKKLMKRTQTKELETKPTGSCSIEIRSNVLIRSKRSALSLQDALQSVDYRLCSTERPFNEKMMNLIKRNLKTIINKIKLRLK